MIYILYQPQMRTRWGGGGLKIQTFGGRHRWMGDVAVVIDVRGIETSPLCLSPSSLPSHILYRFSAKDEEEGEVFL